MAEMTYHLQVRVSPLLKERLFQEAAARGVKPSDVVRNVVADFLYRQAEEGQAEKGANHKEVTNNVA
jgi:hypothetical protein